MHFTQDIEEDEELEEIIGMEPDDEEDDIIRSDDSLLTAEGMEQAFSDDNAEFNPSDYRFIKYVEEEDEDYEDTDLAEIVSEDEEYELDPPVYHPVGKRTRNKYSDPQKTIPKRTKPEEEKPKKKSKDEQKWREVKKKSVKKSEKTLASRQILEALLEYFTASRSEATNPLDQLIELNVSYIRSLPSRKSGSTKDKTPNKQNILVGTPPMRQTKLSLGGKFSFQ
jgi:predicted Holliday junction resolvase-like endonuclease